MEWEDEEWELVDSIETQNQSENRCISHLDLGIFTCTMQMSSDCFFVQIEVLRNPSLVGKPVAVQQHQDIIAVSYEGTTSFSNKTQARKLGIKKHDLPEVVRNKFPQVVLVHVPKGFSSKVTYKFYREASRAIFNNVEKQLRDMEKDAFGTVPAKIRTAIERASIDEVLLFIKFSLLGIFRLDEIGSPIFPCQEISVMERIPGSESYETSWNFLQRR